MNEDVTLRIFLNTNNRLLAPSPLKKTCQGMNVNNTEEGFEVAIEEGQCKTRAVLLFVNGCIIRILI